MELTADMVAVRIRDHSVYDRARAATIDALAPHREALPRPVEHARDIPDDVFLDATTTAATTWWTVVNGRPGNTCTYWDLAEGLDVSWKIVLAKAKRLILRGRMDGCWCGCRGDFRVLDDYGGR